MLLRIVRVHGRRGRHADYHASMFHPPAPTALENAEDSRAPHPRAGWALGLALTLIAWCLAWELWLAPTGSGSLALKVLPLLWPTWGMARQRVRSHQAMCLWVWLYVLEGLVRVVSDPVPSRAWAGVEIVISLALFAACVRHIRRVPALRPTK